jgi:hypothetical protein
MESEWVQVVIDACTDIISPFLHGHLTERGITHLQWSFFTLKLLISNKYDDVTHILVCKVTVCGLNNQFDSCAGRVIFLLPPNPFWSPPIQWLWGGHSLMVKVSEYEIGHAPSCSAEVKEFMELYLHSLGFHCVPFGPFTLSVPKYV